MERSVEVLPVILFGIRARMRQFEIAILASYDLTAELSKWLEAGEESIFSLETEKNLPGVRTA